MADLKIVRDALPQAGQIVELAQRCVELFQSYKETETAPRLFDPFRPTTYEDDDSYQGLSLNRMPDELADLVRTSLCLGGDNSPHFVRLQRYRTGDYVLPHRDPKHQSLYILTSSDVDGLTALSPQQGLITIPDRAGTYVEMDFRQWHWVDAVREGPRYSLLTIPGLTSPPHVLAPPPAPKDGLLGRGETGAVAVLAGGDRVVKRCRPTRSYSVFLNFVDGFQSPHLPQIFDVGMAADGSQRVEMERLSPIGAGDEKLWAVVDQFARACHATAENRPLPGDADLEKSLFALAVALGRTAREHNIPLDFDRSNAMVRPATGELVITDPYW